MPRTLHLALVTVALTSAAALSTADLGAQQRAVFHAEANYIEVDAIVTDRQGQFIHDLTTSDFVLHEGNRVQPIDTFYRIDLPTTGNATAAVQPAMFSPDLVVPSGALNGRIYLLYFDVPGGGLGVVTIRHAARQFISDYLQPGDMAAIWDAESAGQTITFTDDKAELLQAADLLKGPAAGFTSAGVGTGQFDQSGRLRDAAEWFSRIQGRRKSLLLFTSGFPSVPVAASNDGLQPMAWLTSSADAGRAFRMPGGPNPQEVAGLADVHVYPIDTNGLAAPVRAMQPGSYAMSDVRFAATSLDADLTSIAMRADALRSIADETGGLSIVDTNDLARGFARIVEDNSHYYVLGYRSPLKMPANRFVSIRVETTRKDLTVRARKGYFSR